MWYNCNQFLDQLLKHRARTNRVTKRSQQKSFQQSLNQYLVKTENYFYQDQ